jgi:hypothetical protein
MEINELQKKELECEALKKTFDEFVESSKELENELETELEHTKEKLARANTEKVVAEKRLLLLQEKIEELGTERAKLLETISSLHEQLSQAESEKKKLETENSYLEQQVRILETSEEDLRYKITEAEESVIFLKEDLELERSERKETEDQLRLELSTLKSEMDSILSVSSDSIHITTPGSYNMMALSSPLTDRSSVITPRADSYGASSPSPIRRLILSPDTSIRSPEMARFSSDVMQSSESVTDSCRSSPRSAVNFSRSNKDGVIGLSKTPKKADLSKEQENTSWGSDFLAEACTKSFGIFSYFGTTTASSGSSSRNNSGTATSSSERKRLNRFESTADSVTGGEF